MASLYWNYKFMAPILIGDTLRLKVKVQSKRETKKPDRGIVVEYVTMLNQRNEVVGEGEHGLMIYRRSAGV
jgi:acyl dehydratase